MPPTGRILLTLVAIITCTGAYFAEWNETHLFNNNWPPHAKFHGSQTMSMALVLGLSSLYFIYRPGNTAPEQRRSLYTAAWFATIYWVTQLSAFLYPGTRGVDPEFGDGAPQVYTCTVFLGMIGFGVGFERRRLAAAEELKRM